MKFKDPVNILIKNTWYITSKKGGLIEYSTIYKDKSYRIMNKRPVCIFSSLNIDYTIIDINFILWYY